VIGALDLSPVTFRVSMRGAGAHRREPPFAMLGACRLDQVSWSGLTCAQVFHDPPDLLAQLILQS
jgi:hypothetical protein